MSVVLDGTLPTGTATLFNENYERKKAVYNSDFLFWIEQSKASSGFYFQDIACVFDTLSLQNLSTKQKYTDIQEDGNRIA